MGSVKAAARGFLSHQRVAICGVARGGDNPANLIYRRLRSMGYEVFAVNPNAVEVEGDRCYGSVRGIPGGVEGVVIATHPGVTEAVVEDCEAAGVRRVWIHRAVGQGSISAAAVARCEGAGIHLIAGACPMMFLEPVDIGHRCMRWAFARRAHIVNPDGPVIP